LREIHSIWIQTAAPSGGNLGACEQGWFYVDGNAVVMTDESGTPTGASERLTTLGSERAVAARLCRRAWEKESGELVKGFNRPLHYARGGVA